MHSLGDAVTLRVIWGSVVKSNLMSVAELTEFVGSKLSTVVQDDAARSPEVRHILP